MTDLNAIPVGIDAETGEIIKVKIAESNILVGGSTRSGKSVFLTCLLASLSSARNTALITIDPKRTEFSKFRERSSCYARTQEEAEIVLRALVEEMERRYEWLESTPDHKTKITNYEEFPLLVVFVDELSYLLNGEDQAANKSILASLTTLQQVAVACGISLVAATQKPSSDAIKSTTMRDNFLQRVAFRTATREHTEVILGKGTASGYPAEQIPKSAKGYAYISTESTDGTRLMKGFFINSKEALDQARKHADKRIELPWLIEALERSGDDV